MKKTYNSNPKQNQASQHNGEGMEELRQTSSAENRPPADTPIILRFNLSFSQNLIFKAMDI